MLNYQRVITKPSFNPRLTFLKVRKPHDHVLTRNPLPATEPMSISLGHTLQEHTPAIVMGLKPATLYFFELEVLICGFNLRVCYISYTLW